MVAHMVSENAKLSLLNNKNDIELVKNLNNIFNWQETVARYP